MVIFRDKNVYKVIERIGNRFKLNGKSKLYAFDDLQKIDDVIYENDDINRKQIVKYAKTKRTILKEGKLPKKLEIKRRNPYNLRSKN